MIRVSRGLRASATITAVSDRVKSSARLGFTDSATPPRVESIEVPAPRRADTKPKKRKKA